MDNKKLKYCAQCRAGEKKIPADFRVKGRIWGISRMIPYNGYICDDHLTMLEDDGAIINIIERL